MTHRSRHTNTHAQIKVSLIGRTLRKAHHARREREARRQAEGAVGRLMVVVHRMTPARRSTRHLTGRPRRAAVASSSRARLRLTRSVPLTVGRVVGSGRDCRRRTRRRPGTAEFTEAAHRRRPGKVHERRHDSQHRQQRTQPAWKW